MTDYISRAGAIELMSGSNIEDHLDSEPTSEPRRYARAAQRVIWSIPAADVAPVVHGHNKLADYNSLFECSVCGWECDDTYCGDGPYYYCPSCGAKMIEEKE